ncbi:MAG: C-GCAxxG-C-C family protein [Promethearchaeota archaeon]
MSKVEQAVSLFIEGFSCGQAILSTYATEFGLERELAIKAGTGFGAGFGRLGKTCGSVTSALLVLSLKYGPNKIDDQAKNKTYGLVRRFIKRFEAVNGSINCNELLGYDLTTSEGLKKAIDNNLFKTICPNFVRSASEILEQLL